MMRRRRLRPTAPPAARTATASPRRGAPAWFELAVTAKNPSLMRRPRAYAASKSRLRRRRSRAGSVSRPGIARRLRFSKMQAAPPGRSASVTTLGYQLAPALGAPARQHSAAVLGGHARTEPVSALAAHLARLIGTLHTVGSVDDPLLSKKGRQG